MPAAGEITGQGDTRRLPCHDGLVYTVEIRIYRPYLRPGADRHGTARDAEAATTGFEGVFVGLDAFDVVRPDGEGIWGDGAAEVVMTSALDDEADIVPSCYIPSAYRPVLYEYSEELLRLGRLATQTYRSRPRL